MVETEGFGRSRGRRLATQEGRALRHYKRRWKVERLFSCFRQLEKISPKVGHNSADNPDQFRVYCAGYGLPVTFQPVISVRRP